MTQRNLHTINTAEEGERGRVGGTPVQFPVFVPRGEKEKKGKLRKPWNLKRAGLCR